MATAVGIQSPILDFSGWDDPHRPFMSPHRAKQGTYISEVKVLVSQSCLTLCDPMDFSLQATLSMGSSRQEYWSG